MKDPVIRNLDGKLDHHKSKAGCKRFIIEKISWCSQ